MTYLISIVLIFAGFSIARFGAGLFITGEAHGGQNTGAGIATLVIQLLGVGMVIWGFIRLIL